MRRWDGGWLHSSRDLLAVLECDHRLRLEHARQAGVLKRPASEADRTLALVAAHGRDHERQALDALQLLVDHRGGRLVRIGDPKFDDELLRAAAEDTEDALAEQVDVVYQAALVVDGFLGFADFLVSIDLVTGEPLLDPASGRRRYEPVDAKLARTAKPAALLQCAAYARALVDLGHPAPQRVHLWLGGGDVVSAPAADLLPLVAEYRERVLGQLASPAVVPTPAHGDARTACGSCAWLAHCDDGRRTARDLSLVAGIRRDQVHRIRERGAGTLDLLAGAGGEHRPPGMGQHTFEGLRAQAALQVAGEGEPLPVVDVFGPAVLEALPAPDPGDLYYDIEGDPFAEGGAGLEYLHGFIDTSGRGSFTAVWAHSRAQEKVAFERIVDRFTAAAAARPGMHVYHYAAYERTALLTLAQRHQTREEEVDQLLRDGRLVDLYAAVRRSVRVSTESYSIKKLEPLFMGDRLRTGVTNAGDSIVEYEEHVLQSLKGDDEGAALTLKRIADYNAYDCEATLELHRWLLGLVGRSGDASSSPPAPAPPATPVKQLTATQQQKAVDAAAATAEADANVQRLLDGVPTAPADRTPTEHARALLAASLGYHWREKKPAWREHYARLAASLVELEEDDDVVLLDDVETGDWAKGTGKKVVRRSVVAGTSSTPADVRSLKGTAIALYEVPPPGASVHAESGRGTHHSVTEVDGAVRFVEGAPMGSTGWDDVPLALLPTTPVDSAKQRDVLRSLARQLLTDDQLDTAWWNFLRRSAPRVPAGLPRTGDSVADVVAALRSMGADVLAVQGPPGTGKTHVGSRVIAALAAQGWRIGVVAQSHQVVENLLRQVLEVDPSVAVGKKPKTTATGSEPWQTTTTPGAWLTDQSNGCVLGGTTWTFTAADVRAGRLDLVVVEEAGQYSLPDALVVGSAAAKLLLLGDPQQLPQVTQGTHAEPVDVSALRHVMGDANIVAGDAGYLLDVTWRMHPDVCAPVSQLQYEGVLHAHPQCATRSLAGVAPGMHLVEVDHEDNRTSSLEEVDAVIAQVRQLLARDWTDKKEAVRPLGVDDVLVVAPFNRQVSALVAGLRDAGFGDVEVGTVDRFQGREAPVVIVSMATSSGEDLPRGVEFLLSRNRLNVALSRAKWAAYLVHSPALRRLTPTSTAGMTALGAFLGVLRNTDQTHDEGN